MPLQFLWEQITEFVIQEMLKLLSILIIALSFTSAYGQDSTMAVYINSQINKIEDRIQESFRLVKDTVLYDEDDSIRRPADALMLRTEYFINNFNQFGRQYKTYVMADADYRMTPEGLQQFFIRNARGEMVPAGTIASITDTSGPQYTNHFNIYRAAESLRV